MSGSSWFHKFAIDGNECSLYVLTLVLSKRSRVLRKLGGGCGQSPPSPDSGSIAMPRPDSQAAGPSAFGAVEIAQSGRGGSIAYREGANTVAFDWEFGASPAIALIFGPAAQTWDRHYPWAAGRQAEIYDVVGAEAVRQKAPDA